MARITEGSAFRRKATPLKYTSRRPRMHPLQQALAVVRLAKQGGLYDLVDDAAKGITRHIRKGQLEDAQKKAQEEAQDRAWKERADREGVSRDILYPKGMEPGSVDFADAIKSVAAQDIADLRDKSGLQVTPGLSAGLRGGRPPLPVGVPGGVPQLQMDPALAPGVGEAISPAIPRSEVPGWINQGFGVGAPPPMPGYEQPPISLPTAQEVADFARGRAVETPTALPPLPSAAQVAAMPQSRLLPGAPQTQLTPPQQAVPFTLGQEERAAAIPQVATTPGIVHSGGPQPPAPPTLPAGAVMPAGTRARRYYAAARRERARRQADTADVIPQTADLLKMSLEEMRQLAKFGLSSNPAIMKAQLKRIAHAAKLVGRVERTPGLMGTIAGRTGAEEGRKYALELARRDKPGEEELDIATKMARLDRLAPKVRRRGGITPPSSKSFNDLYFLKENKNGKLRWFPKLKDPDWKGTKQEKAALEALHKRLRGTSRGQKILNKAALLAQRQNRQRSDAEGRDRVLTPEQMRRLKEQQARSRSEAESALSSIREIVKGDAGSLDSLIGRKAAAHAVSQYLGFIKKEKSAILEAAPKGKMSDADKVRVKSLDAEAKALKSHLKVVRSYRPPAQPAAPTQQVGAKGARKKGGRSTTFISTEQVDRDLAGGSGK